MTRPSLWSLAIVLTLLAGCASGTRSTTGVIAQGSPEAPTLAAAPSRIEGLPAGMPVPKVADGERVVRVIWLAPGQRPDAQPADVPPAATPTVREGERVLRVIKLPPGQRPDAVPAPAPAPAQGGKPQARIVRRRMCPPNLKAVFCPTPTVGCDELCPGGRCGVPR